MLTAEKGKKTQTSLKFSHSTKSYIFSNFRNDQDVKKYTFEKFMKFSRLRKAMKFAPSQVRPAFQYSKGVTIICAQFPLAVKVKGILIKLK